MLRSLQKTLQVAQRAAPLARSAGGFASHKDPRGDHDEHANFAFNEENQKKVGEIIAKYPEGYQQSAVMPLLDLAQRQCGGWLPLGAMDHVSKILRMPKIRTYEVASFYTMYQRQKIGKHFVQVSHCVAPIFFPPSTSSFFTLSRFLLPTPTAPPTASSLHPRLPSVLCATHPPSFPTRTRRVRVPVRISREAPTTTPSPETQQNIIFVFPLPFPIFHSSSHLRQPRECVVWCVCVCAWKLTKRMVGC